MKPNKHKTSQQELMLPFIEKYFQNKINNPWTNTKGVLKGKVKFEDLLGLTFTEIIRTNDEIIFKVNDSMYYSQHHEYECCEDVHIDDIVGDLENLVGSKILRATEDFNKGLTEDSTWSFYNIATIKGHVTIKWYGSSNGYYSETATLTKHINTTTIENEVN